MPSTFIKYPRQNFEFIGGSKESRVCHEHNSRTYKFFGALAFLSNFYHQTLLIFHVTPVHKHEGPTTALFAVDHSSKRSKVSGCDNGCGGAD